MPSYRELKQQAKGLEGVILINKIFRYFGLGSKKISELEGQLKNIKSELQDLFEYGEKFNKYFSKKGWLLHDSFDLSTIKKVVDELEHNGEEAANTVLMDYYDSNNLASRLFLLNGVDEFRVRKRFIDLAFSDYRAERYHAVVPLLLIIMDGAMNDAVGKGFHADDVDLDNWDCLTTADGAIYNIKNIFQTGRRKTRTETIDLPYRNGVLHGMDLGFDNKVVAAKAWCFLFVIRDWIYAKKSEEKRKKEFEEDTRKPTFREVAKSLYDNEKKKEAIGSWIARNTSSEYLDQINNQRQANSNSPEYLVFEFLRLWNDENFGQMAKLFWTKSVTGKGFIGEIRNRFGAIKVDKYSVAAIVDESPAITEIVVSVITKPTEKMQFIFRMMFEDSKKRPAVHGVEDGAWNIVGIRGDM